MSDLVAFLLARIGEDEATAKAATAGPWEWDEPFQSEYPGGEWTDQGPNLTSKTATWMTPEGGGPYPVTVLSAWGYDAWGINAEAADQAHIARHDPARVLREAEAKRKILAEHASGYPTTYPKPSGQPTCGICHCGTWDWEPCDWPCATVRALAAVYSDHPAYLEQWGYEP